MTSTPLPPVVDADTWQHELDALRIREKAATRELDAIAAQRRRLPMVEMPDYTLEGEKGPVRLAEIFDGRSQLIVYNHMWFPGEEWQCPGCTGFTAQFTRLDILDNFDARFVVVTQGPIDEALAYRRRVGNTMTWYSTANSSFGTDVGAPPGGGFGVNVFLRDGDTCTAPGTPRAGAPSSSGTPSGSSTCSRTAGRRSGRTRPKAGRSRPPTAGGPARTTSRRSTARGDVRAGYLRSRHRPTRMAAAGLSPAAMWAAPAMMGGVGASVRLITRRSQVPHPAPATTNHHVRDPIADGGRAFDRVG